MGITGLIPFLEKASRKVNISEFSGCSVAIDSYCWLHKGAFACAEKLVRGEHTDVYIKYCLKYVTMLLSKNIKPILVFDGQHLPAKAMTEAKRRESRNASKKRAAELLVLGKTDEARSYVRRSVDITHEMALALIKECRKRNVDCIVAPYEADAQLAYLNIRNYAQVVITEDSDLLLFGCTKVLFKMDLDGSGVLVEANKLPLAMRCPIEKYSFSKFRQMCVMSGCDYLSSLPGIGLVKARQFMNATHDPDIANALKKLPSFFNKSSLIVSDEYRESFLRAEATFKHQYVFDPLTRSMVRLNDIDDEDTELAFCSNAGEVLPEKVSLQLMLGNLDPFTLRQVDDWTPDFRIPLKHNIKTDSWKQTSISTHTSIWSKEFEKYLKNDCPWKKQQVNKITEHIIKKPLTRPKKKMISMVNVIVPETADESLSIENLSNMYCVEPITKRVKLDECESQELEIDHNIALTENAISANLTEPTSPILSSKYNGLKSLSKFPRTVLDANVVESKFFNAPIEISDSIIEDSQVKSPVLTPKTRNPFKVKEINLSELESPIDKNINLEDVEVICDSQKENSPKKSPVSEGIYRSKGVRNLFGLEHKVQSFDSLSPDIIENTYPMESLITPVDSQNSFGESQPSPPKILEEWKSKYDKTKAVVAASNPSKITSFTRKPGCKVPGLKKSISLPSNQPTLLSKFGFQKKPAMKR